jgi:hypothetical protein
MYVHFLHLPRSFVFTGCESKAVSNANFAASQPQLFGATPWTGVAPLATYSVAATPDVSVNASD